MSVNSGDIQKRLLQAKLRNAKLKNVALKRQQVDEDQGIFRESILPAINVATSEAVGFFGDLGKLDRMLTVYLRNKVGLETSDEYVNQTAGKFPTSEETRSAFSQLGIDVDPDKSTSFRTMVAEGTRLGTSTALFGLPSTARTAVSQGLRSAIPRVATDMTIGGAAGVARGTAEASGVEDPLALGLIELGTGIGTATALGTARLGKRVADPLTKAGRKRIVAETIQEESTDPKAAAKRLSGQADLPQTAFEQTDDIGLARIQRGLMDDAKTAERVNKISQVRTVEAANRLNADFPGSGIHDFLTPVGQRYREVLASLSDKTDRAVRKATELLSRPRGTDPKSQVDSALKARQLINKSMDEWDDIGKGLWANVSDDVMTDTTSIKITLRDILRKQARSEVDSNKIPQEIIDKVNGLRPIDSVKEVQAIRSGMLKEIRSNKAGLTPEKARARKLNKLQTASLNTLQRGAGGDNYKIARQHTFIQNELYSRGVIGDITSLKLTGADRVDPTGTLAAVISGRNKLDNVNKIRLGVGKEIDEPLQDFMEAQFVRKSFPQGEAGAFNPEAANRYVTENSEVLAMLPDLDRRLRGSAIAAASAKRRSLKLNKTVESVKRHSVASKALGADPDLAVEAALSSTKFTPNKALANVLRTAKRAGGEKAVAGVRRAIYRSWMSRSIDDLPDKTFRFSPIKMRANIKKLGLEGNIPQESIDNMTSLADEFGRIETFLKSPSQAASIEQQVSVLSILSRIVGARIGGAIGGSTSGGTIQSAAIMSRLLTKLSLSFGQKKLISVLEESIDNKEVLRDLLTMPTSKNQVALFKRITNLIANLGNDLEAIEDQ